MGLRAEIAWHRLREARGDGWDETLRLIKNGDTAENEHLGLLAFSGHFAGPVRDDAKKLLTYRKEIEVHFRHSDNALREAAFYAWGWIVSRTGFVPVPEILDRIALHWFDALVRGRQTVAGNVLHLFLGKLDREAWRPRRSDAQIATLTNVIKSDSSFANFGAAVLVLYTIPG